MTTESIITKEGEEAWKEAIAEVELEESGNSLFCRVELDPIVIEATRKQTSLLKLLTRTGKKNKSIETMEKITFKEKIKRRIMHFRFKLGNWIAGTTPVYEYDEDNNEDQDTWF